MTPTLTGRIQTRLALLATIGLAWTILVTPVLPAGGAGIGDVYRATLLALLVVAIFGVVWELIYHALQQLRWEKDWPIMIGFFQGIPEFFTTRAIVHGFLDPNPPELAFILHFFSTWILVWIVANGPLRVLSLRWRYKGGRLL